MTEWLNKIKEARSHAARICLLIEADLADVTHDELLTLHAEVRRMVEDDDATI